MQTIKVDTNNNVSVVELAAPLYKSLAAEFGDHPEHVRPRRLPPPYCMMVDDSGLLKQLPLNFVGSCLYETDKHNQPIVGDIFIMKDSVSNGGEYETIGLNASDIEQIKKLITCILEHNPAGRG